MCFESLASSLSFSMVFLIEAQNNIEGSADPAHDACWPFRVCSVFGNCVDGISIHKTPMGEKTLRVHLSFDGVSRLAQGHAF